jgi:hypothetical protein
MVPQTGTYKIRYRVASNLSVGAGAGRIQAKTDGIIDGTAGIAGTGSWQNFETVESEVMFRKVGVQDLTLNYKIGDFNINWFDFVKDGMFVEAEDFSSVSGAKKQYNPTDEHGGSVLYQFQDGDWAEYEINVAEPGTYSFSFRITAGNAETASTAVKLRVFSVLDSSKVEAAYGAFPGTGSFTNWKTYTMPITFTRGGPQVLRLELEGGNTQLNWFEIR